MDMQFQEIEHFLKNIDPKELIDKIASFRKLNFKKMSEQDIFKEILQVLCFPGKFCYTPNILKYPQNTRFFRVRKLKSSNIKESGLTVISDFWNPPEKYVNEYGRLNKPHESLLYTSPINPLIAINEMKLKKDDYYAVIVYLSQRDIMEVCYTTFTGWGEDAKIKSLYIKREKIYKNWEDKWINMFDYKNMQADEDENNSINIKTERYKILMESFKKNIEMFQPGNYSWGDRPNINFMK